MNLRWKPKSRRDIYQRLAKEKGYRSRAAFKLLYIQRKYKVIKHGNRVLDLGAAPGGMTQVASHIVGEKGLVVALDRARIKPFTEKNVAVLRGDVLSPQVDRSVLDLTGGNKVDVVISDLSPRLSGVKQLDLARQMELIQACSRLASSLLRRGGNLLVKSFEDPYLKTFEAELSRKFRDVKRIVTPPTRKRSSELFLLALGRV